MTAAFMPRPLVRAYSSTCVPSRVLPNGLLVASPAAAGPVQRARAAHAARRNPVEFLMVSPPAEPSNPLLPAEEDERRHAAERHQPQRHRIAPLPLQLRHVLEVHAVDAGD